MKDNNICLNWIPEQDIVTRIRSILPKESDTSPNFQQYVCWDAALYILGLKINGEEPIIRNNQIIPPHLPSDPTYEFLKKCGFKKSKKSDLALVVFYETFNFDNKREKYIFHIGINLGSFLGKELIFQKCGLFEPEITSLDKAIKKHYNKNYSLYTPEEVGVEFFQLSKNSKKIIQPPKKISYGPNRI